MRIKGLNRTAHRPQATELLYYQAITQLAMAEWCSGEWTQLALVSFPVAPWQDNKPLFKVAACFFHTFTTSTIGSFSALFLVKYQFEIAWCLCFPQLINHPIFWSMPVSCSCRQLSSELVVTSVKEHQEGENYIWENSGCPRKSHTNSLRSLKHSHQ